MLYLCSEQRWIVALLVKLFAQELFALFFLFFFVFLYFLVVIVCIAATWRIQDEYNKVVGTDSSYSVGGSLLVA